MELPEELRALVNKSVAILGQVIKRELGQDKFAFIENLRVGMTEIRGTSLDESYAKLQAHYGELKSLKLKELHAIAHSFTLMLELMNACENAYRNYRLRARPSFKPDGELPDAIIYVLTAHPTEARSPQNIEIFHQIQDLLTSALNSGEPVLSLKHAQELLNLLEIAWRTPVVRSRAPKVKDEAEHIYSLLFRGDVLFSLIEMDQRQVPFFVRSWVGGDKDGHPGVNEKTLIESLTLSRQTLMRVVSSELFKVKTALQLFSAPALIEKLKGLERQIQNLRTVKTGDAKHILKFRTAMTDLRVSYRNLLGATHPNLLRLRQLLRTFPALVVPLELRESSDVLMSEQKLRPKLAIYKMLAQVERISRGTDPRWYARGFIISMAESFEHIQAAGEFQKSVFKSLRLPIIPLFEEASSLANSSRIIGQMVKDRAMVKAAKEFWEDKIEIMVGYSDSSKEAGVLASRLAISKALPQLEKTCEAAGLQAVFFHGSGGSIDRGGGSIEDQTAWWPKSALRHYKVTVQGEMVERSLASPEIAKRQIENIVHNVALGLQKTSGPINSPAVDQFAAEISKSYRIAVTDPQFLKQVEAATPYSYLNVLKIGSRPSKRSAQLTVKGLRAIPWVLCWTQTRVLFPTWWGVGSAWQNTDAKGQAALKAAFAKDPVFTSYIKALGFTLAKVRLNIWKIYLHESGMDSGFSAFEEEFEKTKMAYLEICGQTDLMWYRPWLGESILLRSAMIHPLNLLQILAQKTKDLQLLRVTVTGISSGMLTTG